MKRSCVKRQAPSTYTLLNVPLCILGNTGKIHAMMCTGALSDLWGLNVTSGGFIVNMLLCVELSVFSPLSTMFMLFLQKRKE